MLFMQFYPIVVCQFSSLGPQNLNIPVLTLNLCKWHLSATPPAPLPHPSSSRPQTSEFCLSISVIHVVICLCICTNRPSTNIAIPLIQISFRSCVFYQECASSSNCVHKGQTNGQFASSQLIVTPQEGEESEC